MRVIDLFEGAGGFTKGASALTHDIVGYELDDDACATSRAAGFEVVQANLANVDPWDIARRNFHLHLHASPPCTTFSAAGRGHGRKFVDDLCVAVRDLLAGDDWDDVLAGLPDDIDDTSKLVLVPARWIAALEPDTISMEQVRAVLPIWDAYAEALEVIGGYSAWTALLSAEQYGLPQTRIRAWLGASRDRVCEPPTPTHSKYHNRNPTKLDEGVLPWVSMADALGWALTHRPSYTVTAGGADTGGAEPFGNGARQQMRKAETRGEFTHYAPAGVSQKSHPAKPRPLDEAPAPTVTSQANHYFYDAETVQFGENLDAVSGSQYGKNARKITVEEAAVLQGFPADYPFQGTKTSKFRQVGNAVPPPVAEVVLRSLTDKEE